MSGEKTEKPTLKRLRDARSKGQVPKSAEVTTTCVFVAVTAMLLIARSFVWERTQNFAEFAFSAAFAKDFVRGLPHLATTAFVTIVLLVAPFVLVAAIVAAIVGWMQVGGLITMEPLAPKPEKISPMAGLKRIFSGKTLLNFAMTLLKSSLLAPLLYALIKSSIPDLMRTPELPVAHIGLTGFLLIVKMMLFAVLVFVPMAAVDLAIQVHMYIDQLKMSKHDVKQDYKETEGDPLIKSHRRATARKLAFEGTRAKVKKASAVVTNPTHVAVALRYEPDETPLPIVVAKGADDGATMIRLLAKEEGIPIIENISLARKLYATTGEQEFIHSDVFEAVAEVLCWVQEIKQNAANSAEPEPTNLFVRPDEEA
ncbi:type III secretion system export apparatus subunit SctU [Burkholderia diffusa]|uniref:type III secretion system export apparatus subunit SctU n=1 Tax=Burkholderia diffusa TaxID=488732 RepID=UPI000755EAE2|nr:type III secretion system export apparatus subunit SctU [Burkholderia diffusa]KVM90588.1 hypothetical protein WJ62_03020 [Burkholderia diffusa]